MKPSLFVVLNYCRKGIEIWAVDNLIIMSSSVHILQNGICLITLQYTCMFNYLQLHLLTRCDIESILVIYQSIQVIRIIRNA